MTASPEQTTGPVRVAVAIVTFDSAPHIERCLTSLESALADDAGVRLFVVDNASNDATVERARSTSRRAELIVNDRNLGFGAAGNQAIQRALETGAEYLYLLNPDTVVERGFLREALAVAAADPTAAAVQSLLLLEPESGLIDSAGNRLHFLGFGYCALHRRPRAEAPTEPVEIAFPSGAGALWRVAALSRAGRFREDLELFCEDLDLGWRLRLAGFRSLLAPASIVRHRHEFARHRRKHYLLERNRFLVLLANYSFRSLVVLAPSLVANELAIAAIATVQGWLPAKLRSWAALARPRAWRDVRAARRRVAAIRVAPDHEVVRPFTARMELGAPARPLLDRVVNPLLAGLWSVLRRWL